MVDYTTNGQEKKKNPGCLGAILLILLILGLLSLAAYFFLPAILVKSTSDGFLYEILPDEARVEIENFNRLITENIGQLEQYGLNPDEASAIIESLDYKAAKSILDDFENREISDTSDLLDIIQSHIDLSAMDIKEIKKDYYAPVSQTDLQNTLSNLTGNPLLLRSGFNFVKETILLKLKEQENRDEIENISETGASDDAVPATGSTKKKK